jgi:hypothetical protein
MPYIRTRFFSVSKSGTFLFSIVIFLLSGPSPARMTLAKKWFIHLEINLSSKKEREILDVHAKKALI